MVEEAASASSTRITIDGDTSTNDCFVIIASHPAGRPTHHLRREPTRPALRAAVISLAKELAPAIVRDGEGATKFCTITIKGGRNEVRCRLAVYAIAH